jgi:hypothetical protein
VNIGRHLMQVGGFLFYSAAPMATTSQDRKNKKKSEKAFSESTPIHALLKYGLDGGSENFESAVNAYVAWAKTRSVQSRLLLLQSFDRNVGKARRKRISGGKISTMSVYHLGLSGRKTDSILGSSLSS